MSKQVAEKPMRKSHRELTNRLKNNNSRLAKNQLSNFATPTKSQFTNTLPTKEESKKQAVLQHVDDANLNNLFEDNMNQVGIQLNG